MTQKRFDALKQVAAIVTDGDLDSIQDWGPDAVQHVKDLRAMGFRVKVTLFTDWPRAESWAEKRFG